MSMKLKEEILRLVAMKQEGGYWDFKKQWHDKRTDLLHDIICMANNLHNRAAYIIIGIDEEQDYAVVDVKADLNRRNTQKMVDFLKDKKFAGGIRPLVHVEPVSLRHGDIDVIIIENSFNTPFYLTEQFEGIRANHIYTRVMDTNTPKDKSADINNVEYLWRKRFHLDEMPIDKFRHYLQNPDDWEQIQDNDMGFYYKYAPEYTLISENDDRNGYEYYMFGQIDSSPSWWLITLRYHQTAIGQYLGISLDGGRGFAVAPCRAYDLIDFGISSVGFYLRDDLHYRVLHFCHKKETVEELSYVNYFKAVLIFSSKIEYRQFLSYVKHNLDRYKSLYEQQDDAMMPHFPELKGYVMDHFRKEYRDALVMKKMLEEFRTGIYSENLLEEEE